MKNNMKLDFVKDLYQKGLFGIYEGFDTWQEAVKASTTPLVEKGIVEPAYGDRILENVKENGPYFFIAPHIAMPHATNGFDLVKEPAVSFVKINKPVYCDAPDSPDWGSELFFTIAVKEANAHLETIMKLADLLDDEETVNALVDAKTEEDFKKLLG